MCILKQNTPTPNPWNSFKSFLSSPNMNLFIEQYFQKLVYEKSVSPHTLRAYKKDLSDFQEYIISLGIDDFSQITTQHISLWLQQMGIDKISARTKARKMAAVNSFYRFLIEGDICSKNPFSVFKAPKSSKKTPMTSPEQEIIAVLEALPEENPSQIRNKALFFLLYGAGIRSEELCNIRLEDINWSQSLIYILGKGGKQRLAPILPLVQQYLVQWKSVRSLYDKGISNKFFISRTGKDLDTSLIRKLTSTLSFKGKKFHPHAFRYTFASHLLEHGADLRIIQELLGHQKLSTTERYTKVRIDQLKTQLQKFHPHA
ncbi:MAG: tyrosine-type recombinase/integrase [Brevinema sp.]